MDSAVLKAGKASDGASSLLKKGDRHLAVNVFSGSYGGPLGARPLFQQAVRVVPGVLLALWCLTGEARAQGPALTYEKKTSWAETLVALRAQTAGQAGLFVPQPIFPLWPPGRSQATASPLVALWAQLERDFPLECDWMLQDLAARGYPCSNPVRPDQYPLRWFGPRADAGLAKKLLLGVVEELGDAGENARFELEKLSQAGTPPDTRPWLELYAAACRTRREQRLSKLAAKCPAFVFTKHFNMGGSHYAFTEGLSDAQSERHFVPGSALCLLEWKDAVPVVRTLLEDRDGVIRDPDVSYEADRVLFTWKKSDRLDDYHLHELHLDSGRVRQLTFGLGFADYEGAYLPGGDLLFSSTRCVQAVDCFFTEVSNLYTCDRDGRFLRRLGFDQVHTNYATVTKDGRVLYTRWEYNDRGQIFTQALFQMNPDGTAQSECYGNNSFFPTAILHARQIPGTHKAVAIAAGHHTRQTGKLIVLDPARGRQENQGAQLIAPVRTTPAVTVNAYGQEGELWQYPYPLSETEFLVSYSPWGWGREPLLFGIYFTMLDGRRELLVQDSLVSCNQPVPLRRPAPHVRPSTTDYTRQTGTFYVQDVYAGPGLAGLPRGTAKKLRVIGLDFRATVIGGNHNRGEAGEAFVATPVAVAQGSWEAKTVLGETPICADGSAFFTAPARTPVYFQVIDEKGHVMQTMRSWTTLQPGENASCVGCHEHKNETPLAAPVQETLPRRPQPLEPFYGEPRGFSFPREIQPILDRHCTGCHHDRSGLVWLAGTRASGTDAAQADDHEVAFSLLATTTTDWASKRRFSDGYLALTGAVWGYDRSLEGTSRSLVNWISPQSGPPLRRPYAAGAATSGLMKLLEEGHEDVTLNREELDKLACWIDLVVPYCGDYLEADAWAPFERARYDHFLNKRKKMQAVEARNIRQLVAGQKRKEEVVSTEGHAEQPRLTFRPVTLAELDRYRNLAANAYDLRGTVAAFPHATANRECRNDPVFAARNAIDGQRQNDRHGPWPVQSWGPEKTGPSWWQVDFGRVVEMDKVVIVLRADFPHDSYWHRATLAFSDGHRRTIDLEKKAEPQVFTFDVRRTSSLRLEDLVQDEPPGWCALTDVEAWGRDRIPVAEDLDTLAP